MPLVASTTATRTSAFGAQLRRYREAAGLTQEELAERAGLAAKAIGALERGDRRRPYPRTVRMLADALGLDEVRRRELIAAVPATPIGARHGSTDLVGRRHELDALTARLTEAIAGRGGLAFLVGEAGIGKTHLARELARRAAAQGLTVLSGRCSEGEGQPAFGPWVEAMEGYLRSRAPGDLRHELGSDASHVAQIVPALRGMIPDIAPAERLGANDERARSYDAIARVLTTSAAHQPLLLFLDDLQWADHDTLGLMRHVARRLTGSRLLIVGAYRDPEPGITPGHRLKATLAALRHDAGYDAIRLRGLSPQEIGTYLDRAAGRTVPHALAHRIEHVTKGNPFYAREVFRHIAELGEPRSDARTADAFLDDLGVPDGVREVVADRVRRLSPDAARLLRDASGFSGPFAFAELQVLSGLPEADLLDRLDESLEAGFIEQASPSATQYEFAHAIVRHAVYEAQSRDRRVRLHRRIAVAIEQVYRGRELDHAAELAAQYHASAELPGAAAGLRYALAAAERARSAFAHDRVVTLLRLARHLSAEASAAETAQIWARLALAEALTIRLDEARVSADRAVDAMDAAGASVDARVTFLATLAHALKRAGAEPRLWEPLVDRGLGLLGGERGALWARLTLLRDNYEAIRGGPIASGRWLGQDGAAVAIAQATGNEIDHATSLEPLEWRSRPETDRIHDLVRTWSQPLAVIRGYEVVIRDLVYRHGAFADGLSAANELLAAAERFGSVSAEAEARSQIAVCHVGLGQLALARDSMTLADDAIARLGPSHRLHLIPIGIDMTIGYFRDVDWEPLATAAASFATAPNAARGPVGLVGAAYAALCLARANKREQWQAWIDHLTPALLSVPPRTYLHNYAVVAAATAVWEREAVHHAAAYKQMLLELVRAGVGDPASFGPIELGVARMASLSGEHEEALGYFGGARQKAEWKRHRPLQAVLDHDEARAIVKSRAPDRRRAGALLERAADSFASLGMAVWTHRVAEAKQELLRASPRAGASTPAH